MSRARKWLVVLGLVPCCAAPGPPVPSVESRLLAYLDSEFDPDAPGGVVLVARGSEVLLHRAYGLADVEEGLPLEPTDSLPIGSITKSFAAAAILRLVDEGQLALDQDVRDIIPEAATDGRRVTLEQLLTHTSGMPNLVDRPGFEEWALRERSLEELLERTKGMRWLSEPGEEVHYSDSGYILLGAVVERISGLSFGDFVVRELADPLGMTGTRSADPPRPEDPIGYSAGERVTPIHMSVPHAAGQLTSTVQDLHRWVSAWKRDQIASPSLSRMAWSPRALPDGTVSGYGFGWKRDTLAGHELIGHGGWVPGFTAGLVHLPGANLTAIALVNTDDSNPEASYIARRSLRLILTGSPRVATVEISDSRRAQLIGRYTTRTGTLLSIESAGDDTALTAIWEGDDPLRLLALSETTFAVEGSDGTWRFEFEPAQSGESRTVRTSLSGEPRTRATRVPSPGFE